MVIVSLLLKYFLVRMLSINTNTPASSVVLSAEEIQKLSNCCEKEKNLMVSIFDMGTKEFLYHNSCFKSILGYTKKEMTIGGWDFWFQKIKPDELPETRQLIESVIGDEDYLTGRNPFLSFSYHLQAASRKWYYLQHQVSLMVSPYNELVISYLYDLSNKERIENIFSRYLFSTQENNHQISNREKEVLQLIGEGFSSREIAERLYISIHTAISHRKNLIEKFKVKNSAQLIKEASKIDLI